MTARGTIEERFWSKVHRTHGGCWLWTGAVDDKGYGQFWAGRTQKAHRQAWILSIGEIPIGLWVCHSCDTPSCVRPEHLWLGTREQNEDDARAKGRLRLRWSREQTSKLTTSEVMLILSSTETARVLASRYGVTAPMIRLIKQGKRRTALWNVANHTEACPHTSRQSTLI